MTYNPNEIYQALIKSGEEYADKKAAFLLLDSMTKPILSACFCRSLGSSATEKRELMHADRQYTDHLQAVSDARRSFLLSEVSYKSMQALADARRTEASTRRAEAKYVGLQDA